MHARESARLKSASPLRAWFLKGRPDHPDAAAAHHTAPWWQVMCLTGVDYFSTLGYQPSIAFIAAGYLSPIATLILVLLTLFGALPVYNRIAALSPHGQGSLSVLEERLPRWRGKAAVLCLLGFAATDFVITITLSAADATEHIIDNPFVPDWLHSQMGITLVLIALLAGVFLRGFQEAIVIAVGVVAAYLVLNGALVGYELWQLIHHPSLLGDWWRNLFVQQSNPVMILLLAVLMFPKLALGLSGFETGVAVMPLVAGAGKTDVERLASRIERTRVMLRTAALIMSVLLMASAVVTTTMIPAAEFRDHGAANGRALAFLAHRDLGEIFGTLYDAATIAILWFAGASAMAGLLNLIPRYLPRYGMAPDWARATRPLVLLISIIGVVVTVIFNADVNQQGGAYATGVLMLMSSAAVAVTLSHPAERRWLIPVTLLFIYTTIVNIFERPEGLHIAIWFIVIIIGASMISRVLRSTELRIDAIRYDASAEVFIREAVVNESLHIIANRPGEGDAAEYARKLAAASDLHHLPDGAPVLFLEVRPGDASDFSDELAVAGVSVGGFRVLRCESPAIPNAIAGLLLNVRDRTDVTPHAYFGWTEGNPIAYVFRFLAFGEGDTAPVCREVLRKAERDPIRRPRIHLG